MVQELRQIFEVSGQSYKAKAKVEFEVKIEERLHSFLSEGRTNMNDPPPPQKFEKKGGGKRAKL